MNTKTDKSNPYTVNDLVERTFHRQHLNRVNCVNHDPKSNISASCMENSDLNTKHVKLRSGFYYRERCEVEGVDARSECGVIRLWWRRLLFIRNHNRFS